MTKNKGTNDKTGGIGIRESVVGNLSLFCHLLFVICHFLIPSAVFAQQEVQEDRFSLGKTGAAGLADKEASYTWVKPSEEVKYVAGEDKLWFTADDSVYHYFLAEFDGEGNMVRKSCLTAGEDGRIKTADDLTQSRQEFVWEEGKAVGEKVYDPQGALKYSSEYVFDRHGLRTKEIRYDPAGKVIKYLTYSYGKRKELTRDVEYTSPGPDGKWFTADDGVEKYHLREYDRGRISLLRVVEYLRGHDGPGQDGKWFTSDDVVSSAREFFYSDDGKVTRTHKYIGAGPDGKWFSEDDVLQYYTLRGYDDGRRGPEKNEFFAEDIF